MSTDELPVILVAAKDASAANKVISELIEKDFSAESDPKYVWEISNKYYTACVRLQVVCDAGPVPHVDGVEAHVVYLAQDECCAETLERRAGRAKAAAGGGAGDVRLALADCQGGQPKTLQAAALRLNFELVSLRAAAEQGDGEGQGQSEGEAEVGEVRGWARAREALHAHTWRGLQLAAHASPFAAWANTGAEEGSDSASSDGAGGDSEPEPEPDEAECVRRAELFADALCAIEVVRSAEGGGGGGDAERLLRAEQLLAAFCRALGTDLGAL